ncbi:hypothetical protein BV210_11930 [Halorientalis sp. IM1011]|uniref:DUF7537 family lipoprotein n=1 Tax=Halorientalis sp. IM1011 TaxID=1932360 RepID=UPI00097CCB8E|nr:hypothetical protein [Halorientalis sp. IM1011]AQL43355.1 hypothetical protein BV210_11930 [Halorientalis sp. IM1011]
MKRVLVTVAVAAMLVLAGCNGGGQGTPTATNGTESTTESEFSADVSTPTDLDVSVSRAGPGAGGAASADLYPPGVDESGVYNASALVTRHFETAGANAVMRAEFITGGGTTRLVHRNGSSGERFTMVNETRGTAETWWASNATVVRWNGSASPSLTYSQGDTNTYTTYQFTGLFRAVPFLILNTTDLAVDGTTSVDGQEVLRLSIEGVRNTSGGFVVDENISDLRGYVLVTPDGVVREMHYQSTDDRTGATESVTVTVSGVGSTTVDRPSWASGYPDLTVSTGKDSSVLALEHRAGGSIPVDTRLRVGSDFVAYGNVTLSESLEAGETLYVVASGRFGDYNVTGSVGTQPDTPENAVSFDRLPSISVFADGVELQYAPEVGRETGTTGGFGSGT